MKIRVGNNIIDPDIEPVAILFENDADRVLVANQILNMQPRPGARIYAQVPESVVLPEGYMEESVKLAGYVG
jgi:hypothetical protein